MEHHIRLYPPARFASPQYQGSEDPNGKFYVPAFLGPGLVAGVLGFSNKVAVVMMGTGILAAYAADYLHTGMHLEGFWMQRFALYRDLRRLHVIHHRANFHKNYGIYDFSFDLLLGTMAFV